MCFMNSDVRRVKSTSPKGNRKLVEILVVKIRILPSTCPPLRKSGRSLFVAGIVRGIHVFNPPRASAVELDDRFAVGPGEMFHAGGPVAKRARGHRLSGRLIEFITHTEVERAANDGDMFDSGMNVRGN